MDKIIRIPSEYQGYIYVGEAHGRFTTEQGELRDYNNIYVISPVSDFASEDYAASGFKAEKKSCVGNVLPDGIEPGDKIKLFFDDRKRVQMVMKEEE